MPAIYFVGAAGTGKTTLATHIASKFHLPVLPSAARTVFDELYKATFKDWITLMKDQQAYKEYQGFVLARQIDMENAAGGNFVTDRAFDNLIYTAMYGIDAHETFWSERFSDYLKKLVQPTKDFKPVLFFVRPSMECNDAALADGKRSEFLVWEDVLRFDGALDFLMSITKVPHIPISTPRLRERKALIDAVVGPLCYVTPPDHPSMEEDKKVKIMNERGNIPVAVQEIADEMQAWMIDAGVELKDIKMAGMPLHCPFEKYRMRNEDRQAVYERLQEMEESK
jgi:hypothetical protein